MLKFRIDSSGRKWSSVQHAERCRPRRHLGLAVVPCPSHAQTQVLSSKIHRGHPLFATDNASMLERHACQHHHLSKIMGGCILRATKLVLHALLHNPAR